MCDHAGPDCEAELEVCPPGECVEERSHLAGLTIWSRLAVSLTSMALDVQDFTFSRQLTGQRVPFATGGDCYSTAG